ncbi:MAG: ABC transporter ATP-binding protein [Deltaproteobacteria bacterium]|nr:ABC transporter ATP-binding protein [Deltaproteobacteria bacterium]
MAGISLHGVTKRFGELIAVNNVSLEIQKGEFFTLLGPSGCGKTTLLRCVAGFVDHEQGRIFFGQRRVDGIPTHKRNVGMVFQNYAVFPHLSVQDNVKYGLKARKIPVPEQVERARRTLALVRLEGLEHRLPNQLSGGQLQRVAIARALVIEPEVLLMDEPLSNLDAKLRVEMRGEIRILQQEMGITTIYVTHDQEEALSISDRIAVMDQGIVRQVGKPWEVYTKPRDSFVAGFIGTTNMLRGEAAEFREGMFIAKCGRVALGISQVNGADPGTPLHIAIRPEAISIADPDEPVPEGHWGVEGSIVRVEYLGSMVKYEVGFSEDVTLLVTSYNADPRHIRKVGERIELIYPIERAWTFREDERL